MASKPYLINARRAQLLSYLAKNGRPAPSTTPTPDLRQLALQLREELLELEPA
jgi:hypothetical protein